MKAIIISAIAAATLLTSVNTMADLNKSKAMKMTSSGEAMHKKTKTAITANQNMANAKKNNNNKLAKK